jgi:uncharacterized membrane protein
VSENEHTQKREHWTSVLGFRLWFCIYALVAGIVVSALLLLDGAVRVTSIIGFGILSIAWATWLYNYIAKQRS